MPFDIGAGILFSILTSKLFHVPLSVNLILTGILFSLLMDFDYVIHLLKGGDTTNDDEHRDLFHFPLVYIPLGVLVTSFLGTPWVILFILCSLSHFLHDSIGIGWGVEWLFPFTRNHYTFFIDTTRPIKKKCLKNLYMFGNMKKYASSLNDTGTKIGYKTFISSFIHSR